MDRRNFIILGTAALTSTVVPLPSAPASYSCDCGLVRYHWDPVGRHFYATHFAGQRMTYALFRKHQHLHEKMEQVRRLHES